jgi:2-polyprenyl-6-hydroxyphenyl methylase/3-demethylubiquinone-9 3-methyltransferase
MTRLSPGARLRSYLGHYEKPVVEIYRRIYVNLDAFSEEMSRRIDACHILEVGCGEGMLTARLHKTFPAARIVGLDISDRVGRLFPEIPGNVIFLNRTVQSVISEYNQFFDLIVICDVLHHVPVNQRASLLQSVRQLLSPGGSVFIKEWQRKWNVIYWLGYASDRWVTGDRISYLRKVELRELIATSFGRNAIMEEFTLPPWSNNVAFHIMPESDPCYPKPSR